MFFSLFTEEVLKLSILVREKETKERAQQKLAKAEMDQSIFIIHFYNWISLHLALLKLQVASPPMDRTIAVLLATLPSILAARNAINYFNN